MEVQSTGTCAMLFRCSAPPKPCKMPFSSDVSRLVPLVDRVWLITYSQIFGHALSMCMYFICGPSMSNPRQPMDLSVGATKRNNPRIYSWGIGTWETRIKRTFPLLTLPHRHLCLQPANIHPNLIIPCCRKERQKIKVISPGNQRLTVVRFVVVQLQAGQWR